MSRRAFFLCLFLLTDPNPSLIKGQVTPSGKFLWCTSDANIGGLKCYPDFRSSTYHAKCLAYLSEKTAEKNSGLEDEGSLLLDTLYFSDI
uniref:Uncharacterized protein n=1 Tax=Romanomermis culicivorax TaxID=13658 RepID=A0A915JYI7_ROMCU